MEINYLMPAIFIILVFYTTFQIQKRISFNQGIVYGSADLLKHRKYKSYNIWGIIAGLYLIISNIWSLYHSRSYIASPLHREFLGVINGLSTIIISYYSLSNYTAISKSGIDIDGTRIKWEKITRIYNNDFSFIIATKSTNYFIDYADLEDKENFKAKLSSAIDKYNLLDSVTISL